MRSARGDFFLIFLSLVYGEFVDFNYQLLTTSFSSLLLSADLTRCSKTRKITGHEGVNKK